MFWGLKLEAEKQYSQLVEKPFHISHAAIGPVTHETKSGAPVFPQHVVEVHAVIEKTDYVICYLDASKGILQESLDLRISEGEEVVLYCRGLRHTSPHDTVYLTGYFIEEFGYPQTLEELTNDEYSVSDFTEEEEEDSARQELATFLFQDLSSGGSSDEEYTDVSLRDEPPTIEELNGEDSSKGRGKKGDKQTKEDVRGGKPKELKQQDSSRKRKREERPSVPEEKTATETPTPSSSKKKKPKVEEPELVNRKVSTKVPLKKKTKTKPVKLKSGTEFEDLVVGEGKVAKPGKKVFVKYSGRLAQNKKLFDSNTAHGHKPFMFRLGQGEVIRGWDEGVAGMRVGGKRKLTIPSKQGYGAEGAPPDIPPHSNLIFQVELVNVK